MNNIYIIFVILLSSINFLFAMDVAKESDVNTTLLNHTRRKIVELDIVPKAYPIKHSAHILNIPMKDIRYSIEQLPLYQKRICEHKLSSVSIFNIAMLPKELCLKILSLAYDEGGQRYNSKSVFCTPMMQAIMLHQEFRNNPIQIGGKKIQFSTFLMLSPHKRNKIRSAVNPSQVSSFFDGTSDSVLSAENYETIIQLLPDDLEGAQIVQLPSFWQRLKLGLCGDYEVCECRNKINIAGGLAMLQMPLTLGILFESKVASTIGGIIDVGIVIGGILYGISQCRNYIVVITQAQNNQIV